MPERHLRLVHSGEPTEPSIRQQLIDLPRIAQSTDDQLRDRARLVLVGSDEGESLLDQWLRRD